MRSLIILSLIFVLSVASSHGFPFWKPHDQITNFYKCVNSTTHSRIGFSDGFYDPNYNVDSFTSILNSTAENLRCLAPTLQKPLAIFTPANYAQVQAAVYCANQKLLHFRLRSGGHDYEGLSYISLTREPFVLIDLRKIRQVDINISTNTVWVDAGMTVGELYYKISQESSTLAFPAGLCTDLGIGGHITGGAYGSLMRKHGLGVDRMIDARIINFQGKILDRQSMGEDLFWAIRGGGGANFGVIISLKIQLVRVPEKVTVFAVQKFVTLGGKNKENLKLLQKWQNVAPAIDDDLFVRVIMVNVGPNTTLTIYQALYLGKPANLLKVMGASFPEMGLQKKDCIEMKWIESVIFIAGFRTAISPSDLLIPMNPNIGYFKAKSDFVEHAIPEEGLEKMLRFFGEDTAGLMIWTPHGGNMSRVAEDATPYPHRDVLFMIQSVANWGEDSPKLQLQHEAWIRKLYGFMEKYVTKNPRQAYVNYRDLDIGKPEPDWNCSDPGTWGPKYYKDNYPRLVNVKTWADPWDKFRNEQSIPTAYTAYGCTPFDHVGMSK